MVVMQCVIKGRPAEPVRSTWDAYNNSVTSAENIFVYVL